MLQRPPYSEERAAFVQTTVSGTWVWVVPLRGKRRAERVAMRSGRRFIYQRPIDRYGYLGNTQDTRSTEWIEPMSADDQAAHEHAVHTASVLLDFERTFFGFQGDVAYRRRGLLPEDLAALRAMVAKAGR